MKRIIVAFVFLVLTGIVHSQSFEVVVSADSILLGNYIEVSFVSENLEGNFEASDFDGMQIISGPNMSSSIQIINGDKSSTMTYSFKVQPADVGIYTITPAYLISDSHTLETIPVTINVYPNPENIITPPQQKGDDLFLGFGNFDVFGRQEKVKPPTTPTPPTKPKRKYKKL